ncbi:MAG: lytic transglycosylase domain-containing protein [Christensenellales bacterium]|jgi:soluble lytic murein transglycosylase
MNRSERRRRRNALRKRAMLLVISCALLCVLGVVASRAIRTEAARREREILLAAYPIRYQEVVEECAAEFSLETERLYAVMLCESSFRADAVSGAGAVGLMQLLPDTAKWIAEKLGEEYNDAMLTDPRQNARLGSWYLSYLDRRFGGDLTKATAAYHTGQNRVDEWLKDPANSSDGAALEHIPSDATRGYVERVLKAVEMYRELYGGK